MSVCFRGKQRNNAAWISLALVVLALASCDPVYHLRYAVMNDTGRPLYCVDKTKDGPASVVRIEADSFAEVYYEAGIGFARSQFRSSRPEVASRFIIYTDSSLSDSSRIIPRKGWKYYRLPIGDCNARMYIRPKDLR
jgi:hypothetical protein